MISTEKNPLLQTNAPLFNRALSERKHAALEIWHFKLNDPTEGRAFSVRLQVLTSANGFRRISQIWAVSFSRAPGTQEITKLALKQAFGIDAFSVSAGDGNLTIRIGSCELSSTRTRGSLSAKGQSIEWDFEITPATGGFFNLIPSSLRKTRLLSGQAVTVGEDLRFSGTTRINGETQSWMHAPGMQGHTFGRENAHSWTWGHCNAFVDESGAPSDAVFEGLTARSKLVGHIRSPRFSSFYFRYRGQEYRFNTVWDSIHIRSQQSLDGWTFRAERGDLSFRGKLSAEYRDFAGLTYEDTDGSLLYCADSKLSQMTLLVYRAGKLETTLTAHGTAALQVVSRTRNPYVPLLI